MTNIDDRRYTRFFPLAVLLGLLLLLAGSAGPGAHRAGAQSANGLEAEYFDNANLSNPKLSRTDPNVDFSWGKGAPAPGTGADTFSVRWTGQVEAPDTGAYTFYTSTTDGARLWVDGRLVVDKWVSQRKAKEWSGKAQLSAGRHDVKMEYYEKTGAASAKLSWSGPGLSKQVVPQGALFVPAPPPPPPPAPQCSDGTDNDGDGETDTPADPGCASLQDDSESPDPAPPPPPPAPQCSDGADNDGDGKVDHPSDPGCESVEDGSEGPDPTPPPDGVERWSDPATWGGQLPAQNAEVTIPAGKTVLLDESPPRLKGLQIDGALVFEDDEDVTLSAEWVVVHGRLQIGTEAEPFGHRATITLTGSDPAADVMGMGTKLLGVMGGTLDIHGERRLSWTRLGATAVKGSDRITLEEAPNWRPGDKIVVSSTDFDQGQDQDATVTAVSGKTVTLDRPLDRQHWGTIQTLGGKPVDERAEVALLSRNVRIEGEATTSSGGFGGQIMVMGGGTARIEGAELTRMGQKNVLRRYPLHFHMLGDAGQGSYLKDSSIHQTSNRCVTVHGTNFLQIQRNVCYDHVGHGFFFEDGAEHDNVLEGNLGLHTRRPADGERLLPSDASPATFWITNPDNIVRDNVAAGSEGKGFWLAFPEHPTGLFARDKPVETANIWPRRTPLGEFSGNVAHSSNHDGLHVDNGPKLDGNTEAASYNPRANPVPPATGQPDSAPVVAAFEDFTGYKNRNGAVWLRGSNHRLVGSTLADNAIGATFASVESFMQDSLVVGESANLGNPLPTQVKGPDGRALPKPYDPSFPIRGFEFYDGRVGAERMTFVNFTPNAQRPASALGYKLSNAFLPSPRNFASALTFVDANRVYMPNPVAGKDGDASSVFVDVDGSVTGTPNRTVAANNPFLLNGGCVSRTEWNAHVCEAADYVTLNVGTGDGDPNDIKPVKLKRDDGPVQTLWGNQPTSTTAVTNALPSRSYEVAFNGGTPQKTRFALTRGRDRWVRFELPRAEGFKVTRYGCDVGDPARSCYSAANSLADLDARTRSSFYYDDRGDGDPNTGTLHLKLVSTATDSDELKVEPRPTP